jgi:hypothetical protein
MTGIKSNSMRILTLAVAAMALATVRPGLALAQGCPPNEEVSWTERRGDLVIHHCRCVAGFKRYAGVCVKEVCAELQWKLKQAYEGAADSSTATATERLAVSLERHLSVLRSAIEEPSLKELTRNLVRLLALSTAEDVLYARAIHSLETDIDNFLALYPDRRPTDSADVWTAIKNLREFRRLIKQTKADLRLNNCLK